MYGNVTKKLNSNKRILSPIWGLTNFKAIKENDSSLAKKNMLDHQNKVIDYVKRELLIQFYE